jgi:hypothetical protein
MKLRRQSPPPAAAAFPRNCGKLAADAPTLTASFPQFAVKVRSGRVGRLRRLLGGAAAGAVLLATAACGGSAEGAAADLSTENFGSKIATATEAEQSTHLEATMSFQGQSMTMTGDVATAPRLEGVLAQLRMEVPQEGPFEMRMVQGVLYLKGGGISNDEAKPWVKIDLADPSNPLAGFYEQIVANVNPAQAAKMFEAVTELENKGEEEVDGLDTTHYRVTVDMAKALDLSGLADSMGVDPEQLAGKLPDEVTYDVWLETETALMVRMSMDLRGMHMDLHFSDWGQDVSVQPPPAGQVTTFVL